METIRRIYRIDPREIAYLRTTVESYDGMAVVSTVDPRAALVEIRISPGYEGLLTELLKDLAAEEGRMEMAPLREAADCDQDPGTRAEPSCGRQEATRDGAPPGEGAKMQRSEPLPKRYYLATMGCQMNEYDSDYVAQALQKAGFSSVEDPEGADLVLINTCAVRARAEQKAVSLLGRLLGLKRKRPHAIVGLMGCVAQQRGPSLLQRFPGLDLVLGTGETAGIVEALERIERERKRLSLTAPGRGPRPPAGRPGYFMGKVKSFVSVMEGCDNFCTYCIVPYVRGREISRPPEELEREVGGLLREGVREVTLLGQNVNSYRYSEKGDVGFPGLLKRLDRLEGLERMRFTTSHPKDLSDELIRSFRDLEHLCPHIHLPFQAGSNRILAAMKRGYTRETYLELVEKLRSVNPGIAVTSDVMVGFPGESDEDFEMTLELIRRIRFDGLFSFKYSDREGTVARHMEGKVPEQIKASRLSILQELQKGITFQKNKELVGTVHEVLVEGHSKKGAQLTGRTETYKVVNFTSPEKGLGDLVRVRIKRVYANSLSGEEVR